MYRVYAHDAQARINLGIRRRLAPLLGNDRRRIELMNAPAASRCRARRSSTTATRSAWATTSTSATATACARRCSGARDRNAGFSRANPQRLYPAGHHRPRVPLRERSTSRRSRTTRTRCCWWMKRLIALRKRYQAFGRGTIEFLHAEQPRACSPSCGATRTSASSSSPTCRASCSTSSSTSSACKGMVAGRAVRPAPRSRRSASCPYLLTLGPHAFYWFALEPPRGARPRAAPRSRRRRRRRCCASTAAWDDGCCAADGDGGARAASCRAYLRAARWFGGKARIRSQRRSSIAVALADDGDRAASRSCASTTPTGEPETYALPLAFADRRARGAHAHERARRRVIAELEVDGRERRRRAACCTTRCEEPSFAQRAARRRSRRRRQLHGRGRRARRRRRRGRSAACADRRRRPLPVAVLRGRAEQHARSSSATGCILKLLPPAAPRASTPTSRSAASSPSGRLRARRAGRRRARVPRPRRASR